MTTETANSRRFALLGGHGAIIFFTFQRLSEDRPAPITQEEYGASAAICVITFIGLIAAYFAMRNDAKPRLAGALEGVSATIIFLSIASFIAMMIVLALTPVELRPHQP